MESTLEETIADAINSIKQGATKIELHAGGYKITAYKVNQIIRLDLKEEDNNKLSTPNVDKFTT